MNPAFSKIAKTALLTALFLGASGLGQAYAQVEEASETQAAEQSDLDPPPPVYVKNTEADREAEKQKPLLESIEGDNLVVIKTSEGNRQAKAGARLSFGDRVKTSPNSSAKIRYADGSKVLVGRGTEIEVQEQKNGTQWNKVYSGYVRGLIKKSAAPDPAAPPRFIIRSRTVVMGVRGTDFLLNDQISAAKAEVHTLEGVVEVAKDDATLLEGRGVRIYKDQYLTADANAISAPQAFNRSEIETELKKSQPEFESFITKDPDSVTRAQNDAAPKNEKEDGEQDPTRAPVFQFSRFQGSATYLDQRSRSAHFITGTLAWAPFIQVFRFPKFLGGGPMGFRGNLGGTPVVSRSSGHTFVALEVGVHLVIPILGHLLVEPGISMQRWAWGGENAENELNPKLQASLLLSELGTIERLFASVTGYNGLRDTPGDVPSYSNNITTMIYRVGVGFRF